MANKVPQKAFTEVSALQRFYAAVQNPEMRFQIGKETTPPVDYTNTSMLKNDLRRCSFFNRMKMFQRFDILRTRTCKIRNILNTKF